MGGPIGSGFWNLPWGPKPDVGLIRLRALTHSRAQAELGAEVFLVLLLLGHIICYRIYSGYDTQVVVLRVVVLLLLR